MLSARTQMAVAVNSGALAQLAQSVGDVSEQGFDPAESPRLATLFLDSGQAAKAHARQPSSFSRRYPVANVLLCQLLDVKLQLRIKFPFRTLAPEQDLRAIEKAL